MIRFDEPLPCELAELAEEACANGVGLLGHRGPSPRWKGGFVIVVNASEDPGDLAATPPGPGGGEVWVGHIVYGRPDPRARSRPIAKGFRPSNRAVREGIRLARETGGGRHRGEGGRGLL